MFFTIIAKKLSNPPRIKPTIKVPSESMDKGSFKLSKKIRSTGTNWLLFTANKMLYTSKISKKTTSNNFFSVFINPFKLTLGNNLAASVYSLTQFFPWFKVWYAASVKLDVLTCFRISTDTRRTIM